MKLSAWLKENNLTQKQFLDLASTKHSGEFSYHALVKWCSGQRSPRTEDMKVIHQATDGNVTPNDFYLLQ
jgi:transcriptional regulator with XRE-family HTH domain